MPRKYNSTATAERTVPEIKWGELLQLAIETPGNVGNVYNRFHNYSFLNCMLLLSQGAHEPVATFKRWQSLGRQVLKGEKALTIVRPINVKREDQATGEEVSFLRFKPVRCLFQLSQTSGADLPPPPATPEWDVDRALKTLDIKRVPFDHIDGNTQGFSYMRNIAVNPLAVYPLKTTMHEMAHVLHGHTTPDKAVEYAMHRGTAEFEAEGTAYLALNEVGLMTDDAAEVSRGYLQGWLSNEQPSESSIRRVFSATDKLIRAGRVATDGMEIEL